VFQCFGVSVELLLTSPYRAAQAFSLAYLSSTGPKTLSILFSLLRKDGSINDARRKVSPNFNPLSNNAHAWPSTCKGIRYSLAKASLATVEESHNCIRRSAFDHGTKLRRYLAHPSISRGVTAKSFSNFLRNFDRRFHSASRSAVPLSHSNHHRDVQSSLKQTNKSTRLATAREVPRRSH
jgi:hypothetical protein